jgi:outer membrane protein, heavy metal efflux system
MRASLHRAIAGLTITTSIATGCTIRAGNREDALWREYRELARTRDAHPDDAAPFTNARELDRPELVAAVLARNPSIAAAREGLRAALAEIPQATALDDPMVGYEVAPLSIAGQAPFGHAVSVRQKLPFPGKRRLAGDAALAMAETEAAEIDVVRLGLAQLTSELYDDYYAAARALEINAHHRMLYEQMKKSAEVQYMAGRAAQQDPIQAEVGLARLERERIMLEAERDQIVARLNGLLHRAASASLPPPPSELALASAPTGTSAELQDLALRRRPQREAAHARIRAAHARTAVAERASYPDVELMGSYNSMWDMPEHRWMVGVMIDIPLQRARRRAAVGQAQAQTARARFEDERLVDEIRVEVDRAHRRVVEATALVEVQEKKLVPAARAQVDASRAGFASARNSFAAVVQAQENLRESELELELGRAELSRRRAALARAVGLVPGLPEGGAP